MWGRLGAIWGDSMYAGFKYVFRAPAAAPRQIPRKTAWAGTKMGKIRMSSRSLKLRLLAGTHVEDPVVGNICGDLARISRLIFVTVRRTDPMTQPNNNVSLPPSKHASHFLSPGIQLFRIQR